MTDRHDEDTDDEKRVTAPVPGERPASEGVRILGAEEARAVMDGGSASPRLGDQDTRYGDVPSRPNPALRPAVRFPMPADEELPEIEPRHEDWLITPTSAPRPTADPDGTFVDEPPRKIVSSKPKFLDETTGELVIEPQGAADVEMDLTIDTPQASGDSSDSSSGRPGDTDSEADDSSDAGEPAPPVSVFDNPGPAPVSAPLPHWTEPPTGEMPIILPEAEPVDITGEESVAAYSSAPRFHTGVGGFNEDDFTDLEELGDDEPQLGALAAAPENDDDLFDREVAARRKIRPLAGTRPSRPAAPDEEHDGQHPDLATRVITGVGMAVLALFCLKLGRDATTFLATVIVLVCALELFGAFQRRGFRPATIVGVLGCVAIVPIAFERGTWAFPFVLVLVMVFTLLWYLFEVVHTRPVVNVAVTVMGFVYVGVLGGFAGLLLSFDNGVGLILGVAIPVIAYDVLGYLIGSQFGKTRLAPAISPNKTVEGLIGGMTGAIVVSVLIVNRITPWNSVGDALVLGVTVAIMAPLGDLCESLIKRDLGIKDFGSILPGHGGVLDRFDALLFCLPAVYYVARALTIG